MAVVGFRQNYSFTEGVERNASLTLDVVSGRIGRDAVVLLHTQSEDLAKSTFVSGISIYLTNL